MSVAVGNIVANMATKAAASIGNFVKDSINKGSDLWELQNVVDSVFTTMADKVDTFAKSALDTYGLTEKQAKKMVGTFGAMSKSFGYSEKQSYDMSTALAALTGDVASFYNLSVDEAYTKMKSVFTGETESLKELGVVMTQAALDEFALANGYGKTTAKMSEQEKVALRLAFVQDKLASASGDVIRTQDSWANQTRKLSGQIDSFKTAIGQGLINVLTPVIKVINTVMAKLVQLAQLFANFTSMLMGKGSGGGGAGGAMQDVAAAAESAASSTEGIESAAGGAASAAKEAQKSLMGFDEINKLSSTSDAGGGGGGGGSASIPEFDFGAIENQTSIIDQSLSKLSGTVDELLSKFTSGFKAGLGDDFENSIIRIKDHISGIGTSLKGIFTDPSVVASASTMASKITYALGQALGSIVSVGQTYVELMLGGMDKYLEQNAPYIKDRISGIFDTTGGIFEKIGNLTQAIASIFEVFRGDTAKQIVADILGILYNAQLGATELAFKIGEDIINCIAKPIIDNKDLIKTSIDNLLKPVSGILTTLNGSVKQTFDKIFAVYEEKVKPMFESFAKGFSDIVRVLLEAYNTHIAPVLDRLGNKFSEMWTTKVQPTLSKVIEFIGKVANAIKAIWDNFLSPLIQWLIKTIIPVIAPIVETLWTLVMNLFGVVSKVFGAIIDIMGGIIDFITGVFTGDWSLAWEGIKSFFTGIWDSICAALEGVWSVIKAIVDAGITSIKNTIHVTLSVISGVFSSVWEGIKNIVTTVIDGIKFVVTNGFTVIKNIASSIVGGLRDAVVTIFSDMWGVIKNVINSILGGVETLANGVVNGINKVIDALNGLSFDVPDWVPEIGGETFGFNIGKLSTVSLPRLAQGGYVKANQPQPVIVGDNRHHGEIISPEDKMLAVMLQALEQFFSRLRDVGYGNNNNNNDMGDIVIPIYLDGTLLDEVIVTAQQRRNIRSGGR